MSLYPVNVTQRVTWFSTSQWANYKIETSVLSGIGYAQSATGMIKNAKLLSLAPYQLNKFGLVQTFSLLKVGSNLFRQVWSHSRGVGRIGARSPKLSKGLYRGGVCSKHPNERYSVTFESIVELFRPLMYLKFSTLS